MAERGVHVIIRMPAAVVTLMVTLLDVVVVVVIVVIIVVRRRRGWLVRDMQRLGRERGDGKRVVGRRMEIHGPS